MTREEPHICPKCDGTGLIAERSGFAPLDMVFGLMGLFLDDFKEECPMCKGEGLIFFEEEEASNKKLRERG